MKFVPTSLDYGLSPYTGLTRDSWIEAGKFLLNGIFSHIKDMDAPVIVPRKETDITYPHKESTGKQLRLEEMAQKFEGLARSFLVAAPLIHIDHDLEICGYPLREYYRRQVLYACTKGHPNFVGYFEDLEDLAGHADPLRSFQQTVETCALVICLENCRAEIWDTYTQAEKDTVAAFLSSYAPAATVPQNWRFFNMLNMAFLQKAGYVIDTDIMREHAQAVLNYYAGDGWYRDGHCFDYYSCWAFNVYAPIWNDWYGYEHEPYIAAQFEANSNKLMETYADFFDRDGHTNMWGRSNIYRNAATSPFDCNFLLRHPTADPGLSRRIASGSLLQFMTRDDLYHEGIPTIGFYGQFPPLVQSYSCAESVFWLCKAFLCLDLPADHPFWTAKEHNGSWEKLGEREVKETVLDGPALCFTDHNANGTTILRTGKVVKDRKDEHGMWNYSKLSFNSKFPWEAAPSDKVESMQYVLEDGIKGNIQKCNVTLWHGLRDGVLYRRQFFDYALASETHWMQALNLADFPVAHGILRADKLRLYSSPVTLTLGTYGFPDNGTQIIRREDGDAKAIILKGHDHTGQEKQLALTIYDGWDELDLIHSINTNPDSERSIVAYARTARHKRYGYEPFVLISQTITKETLEDFTDDELFPIASIDYTDKERRGGYGPVTIHLKNGEHRTIVFEGIEGNMQL